MAEIATADSLALQGMKNIINERKICVYEEEEYRQAHVKKTKKNPENWKLIFNRNKYLSNL